MAQMGQLQRQWFQTMVAPNAGPRMEDDTYRDREDDRHEEDDDDIGQQRKRQCGTETRESYMHVVPFCHGNLV